MNILEFVTPYGEKLIKDVMKCNLYPFYNPMMGQLEFTQKQFEDQRENVEKFLSIRKDFIRLDEYNEEDKAIYIYLIDINDIDNYID